MAGADANLGRSPFAAGRNENNNIYLSERLERERERKKQGVFGYSMTASSTTGGPQHRNE